MQGPAKEAVDQAIGLLCDSVNRLNNIGLTTGDIYKKSPDELDQNIDALEAASQAIMQEFVARTTILRRLRNERTPIHRLPPEILIEILLGTIHPVEWSLHDLWQLAQVSRYWADLILSTTCFWPEVNHSYSPKLMSATLRRNPSGPLLVRCGIPKATKEVANEFLAETMKYASRWRTLVYSGAAVGNLQTALTCAQSLESLYLRVRPRDPTLQIPRTLPLKHVQIMSSSLQWEINTFSGLSFLALCKLTGPSLVQLCTILWASPRLRKLVLYSWSLSIFGTEGQENDIGSVAGKPIRLPSLESLCIRCIPRYIAHHLIMHIEAPTCRSMHVDDTLPLHFKDSASNFAKMIAPLFAEQEMIHLDFNGDRSGHVRISTEFAPSSSLDWERFLHVEPDTPGVKLYVDMKNAGNSGRDVGKFLQQVSSAKLTLRFSDKARPSTPPFDTRLLLDYFPNIFYLAFVREFDPVPILRRLVEKTDPDEQGRRFWRCLQLSAIRFGLDDTQGGDRDEILLSHIQTMFEKRYASTAVESAFLETGFLDDSSESQPPAKLEMICASSKLYLQLETMNLNGVELYLRDPKGQSEGSLP
ncbi:hypothetical protein FRB99_000324 [Tulasnella sp. 403]|nr:hypothetical protein FRB99_000324 [Tulasnella sp. 403]